MTASLIGALVGLLAGLLAEPLVRILPARSDECLPQAAWIARLRRPPVLELTGALLGAAVGAEIGLGGPLVPALLLVALLLPITVIDLEHRIIPDALVLPGTVVGLIVGIGVAPGRALELVLGAVLGYGLLLALALLNPAGMGYGDVKLVLMLGAFLGWQIFPAVVVGFVLAAVLSIAILLRHGRAGRSIGIPFGPFLAAGALVGLLWGPALLHLYA